VGSVAAFEDVENIKIGRADFMHALDEVQPAFGVSEEELQQVVQNGIIHHSQRVNVSSPQNPLTSGNSQRRQLARRTGPQFGSHPARLRLAAW
jgi:hypothetical protein